MVICKSCWDEFADFKELALHISSSKKGHRKGKKWASRYILLNGLSPKNRNGDRPARVALTEEQKANKEDTRRELSGDNEYATTVCPNCKNKSRPLLPVEFTNNSIAWKIKGSLVVMCSSCGR